MNKHLCLQIYLGTYPSGLFTERNIQHLIHQFNDELEDIEDEIHSRNKHLDVPYTYMMPRYIPNSITI